MNDIPRLEQPAPGHYRFADGYWPLANGLIFDDLAALAFDRTRDTGPHPQMIIGRIDDGVNSASGDVPLHHFEGGRAYVFDHQRLLLGSHSCRRCAMASLLSQSSCDLVSSETDNTPRP